MDKYEFNIKVEQMKKVVNQGDYETAMKIADTIDWRRVRNVNILSLVATVYEKNEEFREAKDILLLAFERAPIGKRLLFKLAELAIKEGNADEAEDYYREFCELAPEDPRQYILRYLILGAKGAPVEQLIHTLEQYCNVELDEKWMYELAELYNEAGMSKLCVMTCDKIMLMFGLGKYVEKAMELKTQYEPLTEYQMDLLENKDKYEEKLKAVERGIPAEEAAYEAARESAPAREEPVEEAQPEERFEQEVSAEPEFDAEPEMPEAEEELTEEAEPEEEIGAEAGDEMESGAEAEIEEEDEAAKTEEEETVSQGDQEEQWAVDARESNSISQDELKARLHEEEARADLAMEMSRLSAQTDSDYSQEGKAAQTRVLTDIRHLTKEPVYGGSNHLMIEAEVSEDGLNLAIDALKKIHRETGATNQAAKISGEKLNRRGIFTISDKLVGKDLIIEHAGDMNEAILQELNQLMARDETGISIVLIDTPERLEELHRIYPGLAKRFECIGTSDEIKEEPVQKPAEDKRPVRRVQPVKQAETVPAPKAGKTPAKKESTPQREAAPASRPSVPKAASAPKAVPAPKAAPDAEEEMDIDDFAKYACQYASDIDCSISGKSMLALYERIEIMEEDGIPLTKKSAEDLIEEAADKAENPSLGKRITGIFSSKYDKEGLLILKEEHFI